MFKILVVLNRMLLVAGVLVALTPCGVCHKDMGPASACSMKHMTGKMDCCHKSKPASPLCKIMDQSSTVSVAKHVAPVSTVAVHFFAAPVLVALRTVSVPSFQLDTSPFRAPLALRI